MTVIGAVLRSSESAAIRSGTRPAQAFIDGYHSGLWLTIGLLAAGVVLSYVTLRQRPRARTGPAMADEARDEVPVPEVAAGEVGALSPRGAADA